MKLLVVDDEIDICGFVKNFFEERNFEVFTAHKGREALDVIEREMPAIVVVDIEMPVIEGMEILKEIKSMKNDIGIVVVTSVDDIEKVEEAKRHGIVEYITKPLSLEQLERAVMMTAEQIRAGDKVSFAESCALYSEVYKA